LRETQRTAFVEVQIKNDRWRWMNQWRSLPRTRELEDVSRGGFQAKSRNICHHQLTLSGLQIYGWRRMCSRR
jgi:hypothetical protein